MSDDGWRLTEAIGVASELRKLLRDWQLADEAFEFLKCRRFESEKVCLLTVVVVDALYSTNLRFEPGRREEVARYIFSIRDRLLKHSADVDKHSADLDLNLVEDIAKTGGTKVNISFASKLCHFFVSEKYPIYDRFVCKALKKLVPQIKLQPYSDFVSACRSVAEPKPPGRTICMRELDHYLWLTGQYLEYDGADNVEERNEVRNLFRKHGDRCRELLPMSNENA